MTKEEEDGRMEEAVQIMREFYKEYGKKRRQDVFGKEEKRKEKNMRKSQ